MPKSVGTGLDSPDVESWKPIHQKPSKANGETSRDISKDVEKAHRQRQNPSR